MAALAFPISELAPLVGQAKEQTARVVVCSRAEHADTVIVLKIAWKTLKLKHQMSHLVRRQESFLAKLAAANFSSYSVDKIKEIVTDIDRLVADERDMLSNARKLGTEIRVFWPLEKLSDQVDHFESIAESLHVECDSEAVALLGFAAEQFAMK